jgi:Zn/Cd-binding protein ZinT
MKNKIIGIVLVILFLTMSSANVTARPIIKNNENGDFPFGFYFKCYVETTVCGDFENIGTHPEFGFVALFRNGANTKTTIYSKEGGEILWHQEGCHRLWLGVFVGNCNITNEKSTMYGYAFFISILVF